LPSRDLRARLPPGPEALIVETLCELERCASALVGFDEPLAETDCTGEPDLNVGP
jgi:hypothetical protein